ncbi:MAG: DUF4830 domain-containing protein [Clostridiales bacterium]|nr:DUF4830 domain-containing protein [Clostridiales bacterium]HOA84411.1 DUF4830 domain-containing protein [Bacillota bacterium]
MFIYTVRASTLRFVGVLCVALVTLITLLAFVPSLGDNNTPAGAPASNSQAIRYDKIKSAADAAEFLSQFGWKVKPTPVEETEVTIPSEFDRIFTSYNEIQKQQGLDLSKYKRKTVKRYTFELAEYNGYDGRVYANVLVYRNRVIGGDICSADMTGFMHGFDVN